MTRRSFQSRLAAATLAGLLFSSIAAIEAAVAEPVEVTVLTSVALTSALDELAPQFERATGNKLKIGYSLIADIKKRVLAGETADVIMLSRPAMDDLQKQDKFAPGSLVDVAATPVAIAVRAGAPKPDISSADALKRSLLAAKSIVYADPAKGGASGVYFAQVVDRLGIAEQLKSRTILVPGAQSAEVVAKGDAEIGVAQASEIVPVAGAQLVGPLPGELGSLTQFTAAIGAGSKQAEAAKSLIQFLTGPAGAPLFISKGFQQGKSSS
ncbi:MAG: Molybdate transport system substrate-binding protein [Bradyrhizobium sp.]|nr:Molybdate transport system substrate-binding protein [Bradyrhizobium sp.]